MAPLILELSSLETEPLEMSVNAPEQEKSLNTLAESEVVALLSGEGTLPLNHRRPSLPDPCSVCCELCFCLPI
jgi:hypothetical protein